MPVCGPIPAEIPQKTISSVVKTRISALVMSLANFHLLL
jgi:hypothetical protein